MRGVAVSARRSRRALLHQNRARETRGVLLGDRWVNVGPQAAKPWQRAKDLLAIYLQLQTRTPIASAHPEGVSSRRTVCLEAPPLRHNVQTRVFSPRKAGPGRFL